MLLIPCPYCGRRPEIEFRGMGEAHIARPDPASASDAEWAAFLYLRGNPKGLIRERWRHVHGCGRIFNAARDTVTDKISATYRAGEMFVDGRQQLPQELPGIAGRLLPPVQGERS